MFMNPRALGPLGFFMAAAALAYILALWSLFALAVSQRSSLQRVLSTGFAVLVALVVR